MIRRFRLERKGAYERLVIAHRLSEMLESFIEGRAAPVEMGSEQGGVPEWDDFVVRHPNDLLEHVQIKKQSTDFCSAAAIKPTAEAPASVIDKALRSLAEWTRPENCNPLDKRKFVLSLSGPGLLLKRDLRVDHLEELCDLCQRDGIDVAALAARNDGPTRKAFEWLTTWCGFADWVHIQSALRLLTVKINGIDADLRDRAIAALARHFVDPQRAHEALLAYINDEAADVSSITCRPLLRHLYPMLRPEVATWTQYRLDNAGEPWSISGTHDVQGNDPESSNAVVRELWRASGAHRRLRVAAEYLPPRTSALSLPTAILRLALHLQGANQSLMVSEPAWRSSAAQELGHTLGIGESDLDHLPWRENTERLNSGSHRQLIGVTAARQEADALSQAMDNEVWAQVAIKLSTRLETISDAELLNEMEVMWRAWREQLEQAPQSRSELFTQLLYPRSEGKNATYALRVGPRTVDLLVIAIETLLLVAVAIGGTGSNWQEFSNCGPVLGIALKQWSGPAGEVPAVRELSADDLFAVIGPAPAPVVVLSGVEGPPSSLLEVGMADDAAVMTSMAAQRQPQLLVTRARITQHLRNGTLASVREHFGKQWRIQADARQAAIEAIGNGA